MLRPSSFFQFRRSGRTSAPNKGAWPIFLPYIASSAYYRDGHNSARFLISSPARALISFSVQAE